MTRPLLLIALLSSWGAAGTAWAGPPPPPPPPQETDEPDDVEIDPEPEVDAAEPVTEEPDASPDTEEPIEEEPPVADASATDEPAEEQAEVETSKPQLKGGQKRRYEFAHPEPPPPEEPDEDERPKHALDTKYLTISGYLQPQYSYRVRKNARPRDQREFGAQQTRAGLIFKGNVLPRWSYRTQFVLGSNVTRVITDAETTDIDGDGTTEAINLRSELVPGLRVEEVWVNYRPVEAESKKGMEIFALDLRMGQMRVPFSSQNRTQNNSLLFPRRSQPVQAFLVGSDLGAEAAMDFADERLEISGAVFNGTGFSVERRNRRGPLYLGRIDISPLGKMFDCECDLEAGGPKFSVGAGLLYSPFRVFDDAGNDTLTRARDLLASASVRVAMFGFFAQAEFLRRQLTDNLSNRPFINTGAHGQLTYFIPVFKNFGMGPVANFGWTASEEAVRPLQRYFTQDGIAFYLSNQHRLDAVRILLLYEGEWRVTEQESAQGGTMQVQIKF